MQRAEMSIIPIYIYTTRHLVAARLRGRIDTVMEVHPTRYLRIAE